MNSYIESPNGQLTAEELHRLINEIRSRPTRAGQRAQCQVEIDWNGGTSEIRTINLGFKTSDDEDRREFLARLLRVRQYGGPDAAEAVFGIAPAPTVLRVSFVERTNVHFPDKLVIYDRKGTPVVTIYVWKYEDLEPWRQCVECALRPNPSIEALAAA